MKQRQQHCFKSLASSKRHFAVSSNKQSPSSKSIFAARAGAKEGAWIAHNSPASLPPSVAVRLSPAVQLLEAENSLVDKSSSSSPSSTASATSHAVGGVATVARRSPPSSPTATTLLLQQQQQEQRARRLLNGERERGAATFTSRESMMESMRARQRERDRLGKPLFWLESAPAASSSSTSSENGSFMSSVGADVVRENERPQGASRGRGAAYADSAGSGLIAFLALVSLPVVFSIGKRYEKSRAQREARVEEMDRIYMQEIDRTASNEQNNGLLLLEPERKVNGTFDTVFGTAGESENSNGIPVVLQTTPLKGKEIHQKVTASKGTGWFWSSSVGNDDESSPSSS